jgi:hypothetical protein
LTEQKWNDDHSEFDGHFDLTSDEQKIHYEYEMLETVEGVYYFNLRRFTEHVKFTLIKEQSLQYEDLPFGGFPSLRPVTDEIMSVDTWETHRLALPNQGILLQWYPKPATIANEATTAELATQEKRKKSTRRHPKNRAR